MGVDAQVEARGGSEPHSHAPAPAAAAAPTAAAAATAAAPQYPWEQFVNTMATTAGKAAGEAAVKGMMNNPAAVASVVAGARH